MTANSRTMTSIKLTRCSDPDTSIGPAPAARSARLYSRATARPKEPNRWISVWTRGVAALIVGQLGGPDDVAKLEPLLNDATVCFGPQMQIQGQPAGVVQMRDAVLVALLQLTNQRPADYGYIGAQLQPLKLYQLRTLFQLDDHRRDEAIGKWRQWRSEQKRTAANSPKAS